METKYVRGPYGAAKPTRPEMLIQIFLSLFAKLLETLKAFEDAAAKISPEEVPVADLDLELHRQAAALAEERARQFVRDIGSLSPGSESGQRYLLP